MISRLSKADFYNKLVKHHREYIYGESTISDDEFDSLVNFYEKKFGEKFLKENIASAPKITEVDELAFEKLPYPMMSVNKAKNIEESDKIVEFAKKFPGPYVFTDKMDGTSLGQSKKAVMRIKMEHTISRFSQHSQMDEQAQAQEQEYIDQLHTSGVNGLEGKNMSHLIEHLRLPNISKLLPDPNVLGVRGELVMTKEDFDKYVESERKKGTKKKLTMMRSVVNSVVNSKTVDPELLSMCRFCAFSIIGSNLSKIEQLETLKSLGYHIPEYHVYVELTPELAFKYLKVRLGIPIEDENSNNIILGDDIGESKYDCDGVCVEPNVVDRTLTESNPDYILAVKFDRDTQMLVVDIEWNPSQYGDYKPTVVLEKGVVFGKNMERSSGWNAQRIFKWKIGIGAVLYCCFAGGVTPHIRGVAQEATEENMVYPPGELGEDYDWNKTKVDFVMKDPLSNPEVRQARIVHFFSTLKIANIGDAVVKKLYEYGYDTLYKLFNMTVQDLLDANIPAIKLANATKYVDHIQTRIKNVEMADLMVATRVFGKSIGLDVVKSLLEGLKKDNIDIYDIWNDADQYTAQKIYDIIINYDNIGTIRTKQISQNFDNLRIWYNEHPQVEIRKVEDEQEIGGNSELNGKLILFTGFVDTELPGSKIKLSTAIKNAGGVIKSNFVKNLDILIMKNLEDTKGKYNQVVENNKKQSKQTEIIQLNTFINRYFP